MLELALAAGHSVRALTRRPQPARDGVIWIDGALDQTDSLDRLADGADSVIHVAGVLNARNAAGFDAGNVAGTRAMLDAAARGGVARFVHVSSLAAREPQLSLYGASKARSEVIVRTAPLDWSIVRPPAVYGPGDRETLDLFKMAAHGLVAMPPRGRLSLIHVDDLALLLLALAQPGAPFGLLVEPDDGRAGGWSHDEFGAALGVAVGRNALTLHTPAALLRLGAHADRLLRGDKAKLTADRAAYFCHPDWVVDPAKAVPPGFWEPSIPTAQGLADTARWYRAAGWL